MRKIILLLAVVMAVMPLCVCARAEGEVDPLLILASPREPLTEDDVPDALRPISTSEQGVHLAMTRTALLQEEALEPLYQMMRAAEKAGETLYIRQAYRSYGDEARRYETLSALGQAAQRPGQSSYQTGLSVTLVGAAWKTKELTVAFATSSESKWLKAHAAEYGFVLRYPEGKEGITGWNYEPWHYRYVGVENAKWMTEQKLCLEELVMGGGEAPEVPMDGPEDGEPWDAEDGLIVRPRKTEHSVPTVRDPSTIAPEDIGPDGDYEISMDDLI